MPMSEDNPQRNAPLFGAHDYQIVCSPPETPVQVDIRAQAAAPLRIGDHFTIDRQNCLYELIVEDLSLLAGGRWSARCRVSDLLWL